MPDEVKIPGVNPLSRLSEIKEQEISEVVEHYEKRKSPFKKWTQLNNDFEAREARYWLMKESSDAYCVMDFLASNMDRYNAVICSYKVLQEKLGYSQATIARAIKLLKEHNYLSVAKTGTSNVYMLNKRLYWNSWGSNYTHAEFDAKIIISATEQDKETKEEIRLQLKTRQEVLVKQEPNNVT